MIYTYRYKHIDIYDMYLSTVDWFKSVISMNWYTCDIYMYVLFCGLHLYMCGKWTLYYLEGQY